MKQTLFLIILSSLICNALSTYVGYLLNTPTYTKECKGHGEECGTWGGCCSTKSISLYCVHGVNDKNHQGHCTSCSDPDEWDTKHQYCHDDDDDDDDAGIESSILVGVLCGLGAIALLATIILFIVIYKKQKERRNLDIILVVDGDNSTAPKCIDLPPNYDDTIKMDRVIDEKPPLYEEAVNNMSVFTEISLSKDTNCTS